MILQLKFRGIDDWNRPVFKSANDRYKSLHFGSVTTLFNYDDSSEKVTEYFKNHLDELEYFGDHFGCEPHGGMPFKGLEFELIN